MRLALIPTLLIAIALSSAPPCVRAQTANAPAKNSADQARQSTDLLARLETIRAALIDRALDRQARVQSTLWLDEGGQLHESTRVSSDLKVRAIRVKPGSHTSVTDAFVVELMPGDGETGKCTSSHQEPGLPLLVEIGREHDKELVDNQVLLGEVGRTIESLLMTHADETSGWLPRAYSGANNYMQWVSAGFIQSAPYLLKITLNLRLSTAPGEIPRWLMDSGLAVFAAPRAAAIEVTARLIETASGQTVWREAAMLPEINPAPRVRRQSPPAEWTQKSAELVASILKNSRAAIKCKRHLFEVSRVSANYFVLNGGGKSGFKPGSQLLVVNGRLIPSRLLESGAIDQTYIGIVRNVYPDHATLELVGTNLPASHEKTWLAYPL